MEPWRKLFKFGKGYVGYDRIFRVYDLSIGSAVNVLVTTGNDQLPRFHAKTERMYSRLSPNLSESQTPAYSNAYVYMSSSINEEEKKKKKKEKKKGENEEKRMKTV